jgi:hypothetical protein
LAPPWALVVVALERKTMSPVRSVVVVVATLLFLAACTSAAPPATSRLLATIPPLPSVVAPTVPAATATASLPSTAPTPTAASTPTTNPASIPPSQQPSSGIAGDWNGTYTSTKFDGTQGTFTVTFTQDGNTISGDITVDSPCVGHGTIDGTSSGDTITFGVVKGNENIAFNGQLSGDTLSGTYTSGKGCANDKGTWSATRTT